MSLTMTERQVGDVTIVDVAGKLTCPAEGEARGPSDDFRDSVERLLSAGKVKLLLNLGGVPYVDSCGLGELARAYGTSLKAGGSVKVLSPTGQVEQLLRIALRTIFEVYDDEQTAVDSFSAETARRYCHCPVCGKKMHPASVGGAHWDRQTCPSCGARVQVGEAAGSSNAVQVLEVDLPTYEGEYLHLTCDRPVIVAVVGRLDLYTSSKLAPLWSAIPSPKRVLFHLDERVEEISGQGWTALMELVSRADGADRAIVSIDSLDRLPEKLRRGLELAEPGLYQWRSLAGMPKVLRQRFAAGACVHIERTTAVTALGALGAEGPWLAKVTGPSRPS